MVNLRLRQGKNAAAGQASPIVSDSLPLEPDYCSVKMCGSCCDLFSV